MNALKSLVDISAWILFIYACIMLINTVIQAWFFDLGAQWTMVGGGIAMLSFFLTTVAVKIRNNLE